MAVAHDGDHGAGAGVERRGAHLGGAVAPCLSVGGWGVGCVCVHQVERESLCGRVGGVLIVFLCVRVRQTEREGIVVWACGWYEDGVLCCVRGDRGRGSSWCAGACEARGHQSLIQTPTPPKQRTTREDDAVGRVLRVEYGQTRLLLEGLRRHLGHVVLRLDKLLLCVERVCGGCVSIHTSV